jgi:hypothetical protein
MLARSLDHNIGPFSNQTYNFIRHYLCDLGRHFEALETVLLKKDSRLHLEKIR